MPRLDDHSHEKCMALQGSSGPLWPMESRVLPPRQLPAHLLQAMQLQGREEGSQVPVHRCLLALPWYLPASNSIT